MLSQDRINLFKKQLSFCSQISVDGNEIKIITMLPNGVNPTGMNIWVLSDESLKDFSGMDTLLEWEYEVLSRYVRDRIVKLMQSRKVGLLFKDPDAHEAWTLYKEDPWYEIQN